ncbi:MAG: single-stranded DNA-binding protein [Patescibacteria group bacterium]
MNLNKAIIIGNLTQDPEVRNTPGGQSVSSFTVATNRVWTDKSGQRQEQAEFHNVVAWGRLAEIVGQYLAKGRLCMVEGRLQTRSWDDQSGNRHWKTEIIAENIQLGPRLGGASSEAPAGGYSSSANTAPRVSAPSADTEEEIKIEDIPF